MRNIFKEQWREIIKNTRENYIGTIKSLSAHQKEIETIIKQVLKEYNNLQNEQIINAFNWIKSNIKKREEYVKIFKNNLYESLSIMPNVENLVFKKQFNEISVLLNETFSKIFTND